MKWRCDGETWNPPVPYPDDEHYYEWNEDEQDWAAPENE
jgi:hypothetical protein